MSTSYKERLKKFPTWHNFSYTSHHDITWFVCVFSSIETRCFDYSVVASAGDFVAAHHIGWYNCLRTVTVHKLLIRGEYHAWPSEQYKLSRVPKFSIFESPIKNTVCIGCCFQMFLRGDWILPRQLKTITFQIWRANRVYNVGFEKSIESFLYRL